MAGEHLTGAQMAAAFTKALEREVRYNSISPDAYRALGFPGAEDLGNMFQFKRDFNESFCSARDPKAARALNPELQTFEQWLAQNRNRSTPASSRSWWAGTPRGSSASGSWSSMRRRPHRKGLTSRGRPPGPAGPAPRRR